MFLFDLFSCMCPTSVETSVKMSKQTKKTDIHSSSSLTSLLKALDF